MICIIKKLWHGSSELAAMFKTASCQNRLSIPGNTGQASWIQRTLPKSLCLLCLSNKNKQTKKAMIMTSLSLCFMIFTVFMLQMWPTPLSLSHKNISPNDLLGHLIPLCSEKPLFKYLAVWDSCQRNTDEKERRRLITGVLLITLHLTYFSLATWDCKKRKLLYLKWQGHYVIFTVRTSNPGSDDNDNGYISSSTLWGDSAQMNSPLEYDTSIAYPKGSKNGYFTDIDIPEREGCSTAIQQRTKQLYRARYWGDSNI